MKLNELFTFFAKTTFVFEAETNPSSASGKPKSAGTDEVKTKLEGFGISNYGGNYVNTFTLKVIQNLEPFEIKEHTYEKIESIPEELLNLEVIELSELALEGCFRESSTGNAYLSNKSRMTIFLK